MQACFHRLRGILCVGFILALVGSIATVQGAESSEISRGLGWLTAQIAPDGSLGAEQSSVANPRQSAAETLLTLASFDASAPALVQRIGSDGDTATEVLARSAIALVRAGQVPSSAIATLRARQNADGGFGDADGASSNSLDTAWTLLAFRVSGFGEAASLKAALDYLVTSARADGGFATPDSRGSIFATSYALQALAAYRDAYASGSYVARATDWLRSARGGDSSYGQTLYDALATLALAANTTDSTQYADLVAALKAAQAEDGSWHHDPFLTSLALRALGGKAPPPPTVQGRVTGQVVDAASRAPLNDASVSVSGLSALTDPNGRFQTAGLGSGAQTLTINRPGYASRQVLVNIAIGTTTDAGIIALDVLADSAVVRGIVSDGASGQALSGVAVRIEVAGQQFSALSASNGAFEIGGVPAGEGMVSVGKTGYRNLSTTLRFVGGTSYSFSPALYADAEPVPTRASLQGRVIAVDTAAPVSGAVVSVGSQNTATAADGSFTLGDLAPGDVQIRVEASGYQAASYQGVLSVGTNKVGDLRLQPATSQGRVKGQVIDAATRAPLAGASIRIAGLSFLSDQDGRFEAGVAIGSQSVLVAKAGYSFSQLQVTVVGGGLADLGSIALAVQSDRALVRGVVVDAGTGQPLAGASILAAVDGVSLSALSAANGAYELSGIPAGSGSITAQKTGYRSAVAAVSLAAGNSYNFSPTLYAEDAEAPTQATLAGRIIAADTAAAISGAQITVAGRSTTSAADGSFSLNQLEPGGVEVKVQAADYDPATFTGMLSAGVNRVGDLRLQRTATTLTLFGKVVDADSGAAVAGALVRVQGSEFRAVSNALGGYRIAGLPERHFNLVVEASGYYGATMPVNVASYGNYESNLPLVKVADRGIELTASVGLPSYAPFSDVQIAVTAENDLAKDRLLIFTARVYDGEWRLIETIPFRQQLLGLGFAETAFRVPANGNLDLGAKWYNQNVPAGDYSIVVAAAEPEGGIVAESAVGVRIDPKVAIGGGLAVDPPMTQAGTAEPVTVSALVSNRGNLDYAGGSARYSIVLDAADASEPLSAKVTPILLGAPLNEPRGSAIDAAGNIYTANSGTRQILRISPGGETQVLATVPVVPTDLALLSDGTLRVLTGDGRMHKIDSSGLAPNPVATGVLSGAIAADSANNLFVGGMTNTGKDVLIRLGADGQRTDLLQKGFSGAMGLAKGADGKLYVTSRNDNSIMRVDAMGRIEGFATVGFPNPAGLLKEPAGSFLVADSNRILRVAPNGGLPSVFVGGLSSPQAMAYAPSGDVLVTAAGSGTVVRVSGSGQVAPFGPSFGTGPTALAYDANGQLYVGGSDGSLRRRNSAGTIETLLPSGGLGTAVTDIAVGDDGTVYAADGVGVGRRYAPGSGKSVPLPGVEGKVSGLVVNDANRLIVAETTTNRITRYNQLLVAETLAQSLLDNPVAVAATADGVRYILNASSLARIPASGRASVLVEHIGGSGIDIAPKPGGGVYLLVDHTKLMAVTPQGAMTLHASVPASRKLAAAADGSVYLADRRSNRIYRLAPDKAVEVFATTPAAISDVDVDAGGNPVVGLDDGVLYRFAPDRSPVKGVATGRHVALSMAADGAAYVLTVDGEFLRVDASGDRTRLADHINGGSHFARLGSGAFDIMEASSALLKQYDANGVLQRTVAGFGSPADVEWMNGEVVFADSAHGRVYRLSESDGVARLFAGTRVSRLHRAGDALYGIVGGAGRVVRIAADGSVSNDYENPSLTSLSGFAVHGDEMALANPGDNRLVMLGASRSVKAAYIGLSLPYGITVDPIGQVYVANATGVVRYSSDGLQGELLPLSGARAVAIGPDGMLWASSGPNLLRYQDGRFVTVTSGPNPITALAFDGDQLHVADAVSLRRLTGDRLVYFAGGLQKVRALRVGGDQALYIGSAAGGIVTRYDFSDLKVVASGVPDLRALTLGPDAMYVAGSREIFSIDPVQGAMRTQGVEPQLPTNAVFYSLSSDAQGSIVALTGGDHTALRVMPSRLQLPPAPGTEVHRASVMLEPIAVGGTPQAVSLGQWIPPYPGDYSFHLAADDGVAGGELTSHLHVGPHVTATVASSRSEAPPGDATVRLSVMVSGVSTASLSRVDADNVRLLHTRPTNLDLKGLGADPAGNVYLKHLVSPQEYRVSRISPDGDMDTMITGRGWLTYSALPVDRQGNLYVFDYQQLLRVRPDRTAEVVATMPSTVRSMVIDSHDNLLVMLWNGQLYKVTQDGAMTQPTPRTPVNVSQIAIDAQDNLYLQHYDMVTRLDPSGHASVVLDGIAGFENEGMPIAGDCADNLLIAPSLWPGMQEAPNGGVTEEHSLIRLSASGHATKVFDGFSVFPLMDDLDFIVYDRFSRSLLMWSRHHDVWRLPMTCGAISTDLHVITPAGQALNGYGLAPDMVVPAEDGGTEHVWSLKDVTALGQALQFDTVLPGMTLGEERAVAREAYLLFHNTFTGGAVKLPLKLPSVRAGGVVTMTVATDRTSYPANADVVIDLAVNNPNPTTVQGRLRLDLVDAQGRVLQTLVDEEQSLEGGTRNVQHPPLGSGTYPAATYQLKASFTDGSGYLQAEASAQFGITASGTDPGADPSVKIAPTTDKTVYGEFETVQLLSRARSLAANYGYENLTQLLTVVDPNGAQVFGESRLIERLPPNGSYEQRGSYKLPGGLVGVFGVHAAIIDRNGSVIASGTTSFEARADDAATLSGSVVATRKTVPVSESQTCRDTIVNGGQRALNELPIRQSVVELASDRVVSTTTQLYDLAAGSQQPLTRVFGTEGYTLGQHACVLEAQLNGQWKALGYDVFTVDPPPIRVTATLELGEKGRVLVLLDGVPATGSQKTEPAPEQQRTFLEKLLTREGWTYTIVTDADAFAWELRSGDYNSYALFSESTKLDERVQKELREAVYRGEGLLEAGAHDQRHHGFDDALGLKYQGKLADVTGVEGLAAEPGPAGYADIALRDKPLRAQLGAATSLGRYLDGKANDPSALATRSYGRGRSIYFGYDLLAEANLAGDTSFHAKLLVQGLSHVQPAYADAQAGRVVPLRITLQNEGNATPGQLRLPMPGGAAIVDRGTATVQGDTLVWNYQLEVDEEESFVTWLRLPLAAGNVTFTAQVLTGSSAQLVPHGSGSLSLRVTAGGGLDEARQLAASAAEFKQVLNWLDKADTALQSDDADSALAQLVKASDELLKVSHASSGNLRLMIDQALLDAGRLYWGG